MNAAAGSGTGLEGRRGAEGVFHRDGLFSVFICSVVILPGVARAKSWQAYGAGDDSERKKE
jgi:hypothetical protein